MAKRRVWEKFSPNGPRKSKGKPSIARGKRIDEAGLQRARCCVEVEQESITRWRIRQTSAQKTCRRWGTVSEVDGRCMCKQHRKLHYGMAVYERDYKHLYRDHPDRRSAGIKPLPRK